MDFETLEVHLESVDNSVDYPKRVDLTISAYPAGNDVIDEHTLVFDSDPVGGNYERAYTEAKLGDPSQYREIHEFLADHLGRGDEMRREAKFPIADGKLYTVHADGHENERDLETLTIDARGSKVSFGPLEVMSPQIRTYETREADGKDRRNVERLLDFFGQLSELPVGDSREIELHDAELAEECFAEYADGEFQEACRRAVVVLEDRVRKLAPAKYSDFNATDMMHQVFSPEDGELQISENNNEQQGLMYLYAGAYLAIRNPLTHRTVDEERNRYMDDLDEIQARNVLHFVDFLLTQLSRQFPDR